MRSNFTLPSISANSVSSGTTANVVAGVDVRAALLDKDVSRKDKLAVRPLRAKALGLGITAVTSGTHSLFMCEQL